MREVGSSNLPAPIGFPPLRRQKGGNPAFFCICLEVQELPCCKHSTVLLIVQSVNTRRTLSQFVALTIAASEMSTATVAAPLRPCVRIVLTVFANGTDLTITGNPLEYLTTLNAWSPTAQQPFVGMSSLSSTIPSDAALPLRVRSGESGIVQIAQGAAARSYRGTITLSMSPRLHILNELSVESYLRGVVPAEMPSSFPPEALKAQAVAARSYALANLGKHKADDADVCDTEHCQAYLGATRERATTDSAIADTAGMILLAGNAVLSAQYSSDCGGVSAVLPPFGTESAHADTDDSGLAYCSDAPWHTWTFTATQVELLKAAKETRQTPIRKITILERDNSGRVKKLRLTHDFGESDMTAESLRRALGNMRLRSRLFELAANPVTGDIIFTGRGNGHGCGLCQWGAKSMASAPNSKDFHSILEHYYPGATISTMDHARNLSSDLLN